MNASDQARQSEGGNAVVGGCHCGAVEMRIASVPEQVLVCNCSICTMKGTLHWIVEKEQFELVKGRDSLTSYRFGTMAAEHMFCSVCGISPFYIARSHPNNIDVNLRCVRGIDVSAIKHRPFDGQNWEQAFAAYHAE